MSYRFYVKILVVCLVTPFFFQNTCAATIKKSLRILMVLDRFPWYTKQPIINQITGLLDKGHEVFVFSQSRMPEYDMGQELKKYRLLERTYFENWPADLSTYDVIIFQYGYLGKEYAHIKKTYNLKAKIVTFFRGADITSIKQTAPQHYDELFAVGDLFLPICEYFRFRLMIMGCDQNKIAVQYSGVDTKKFIYKERSLSSNGKIGIVTVGRLIEKKGIEYVIQAVQIILKKYPNVEYCIIGDGVRRPELELLVKKRGLENKIKFVGWKAQSEIITLLHNAHIFVSPSITSEGGVQDAPINVLKEAMLTGMPVISTFHGGIMELIDSGRSGFLVPERDIASLVKSIEYMIKHCDEWKSLGQEARKKVIALFDNNKLNDQLERLLYAVVG